MRNAFDVIIVGGAMVGATLACALGRQGVQVALIEGREPRPFAPTDDYALRVCALSRASQRIFQGLGVWQAMCARRVSAYESMRVWDATGEGRIGFDAADLGEPDLGHIVENDVVQDALFEVLRALPSVQCLCPALLADFSVEPDRVQVQLQDGSALQGALLVGADGADSRVRQQAGIQTQGQSYQQKGVVATVQTERAHQCTAWQRFLPSGPLAFLPLADGRCSIVWSANEALAEQLMAMDEAAFCSAVGEALDHRLGAVVASSARAAFALRGAQADRYVLPRIALVGDAAHSIHPLAGQGANLGFLDAAMLAQVIAESDRDIGDMRILRRYERARRSENLLMQRVMEGFNYLFGHSLPPLRWARNAGLNLVDSALPVKNELMRRAMGLHGELPALAKTISAD